MKLPIYQVDAFAERLFSGNPAAVCPLEHWLDDRELQAIAQENNLSETAFFVKQEEDYGLRWFTPVREVDLCGHATLASAYVIFNHVEPARNEVAFHTHSGRLVVERHGELLRMDFPASPLQRCTMPALLAQGLGLQPLGKQSLEVWAADDYLAVFEDEATIRALTPDFELLRQLDRRGVIVTARGQECDFVSRFFAPKYGIPEDPVTGSAHCMLAPYWAECMEKSSFHARQLSQRGGDVFCEVVGERVLLSGRAVLYLHGEILLEDRDGSN